MSTATATLAFDIIARDKASGDFKKFGGNVDAAATKMDKARDKLKAFAKVAAVGFVAAGGAAAKFGIDAIGAASDLNETVSKSQVIFGDSFAAMDKWARGAATNMGMSRQAALDASAGFGDMFSQLGFAGKQAAGMSREVVQLSADLGSFNNLPTADVADRMSAAFRGEFDSLQALIPNINAARVEKEALAATGKKSADALTAQEKAAATLAIVQKDGARAAGDFARTSDGLANQQKILKARFADVQAEIGQKLLPIAVKITTWAADKGVPLFQKLVDKMVSVAEGFGEVAEFAGNNKTALKALGATITALIVVTKAHAVATGVAAAGGLLKYLKATKVVTAATKVYTAVQWLLNAALKANPIGIVITVLAALGVAIKMAWERSETFRKVTKGAFEAVAKAGRWLWNNALQPVFKFIVEGIGWLLSKWGQMLKALGKVPGFGWAKAAGETMEAAGRKATEMAADIKKIPNHHHTRITADTRGANLAISYTRSQLASLQALASRGIRVAGVTGYGGFTARAIGGPIGPGRDVLVGERGPEIIRANQPGRVMTAKQTQRAMSGGGSGGANLTINVNGARDPKGIVREIRREFRLHGGSVEAFLGAR